jgi:moderate conductance mechanosensitive channel
VPASGNASVLAIALAAALLGAYIVAHLIARIAESALRGIIESDELERRYVNRPLRVVRVAAFIVIAAALWFPAMSMAGYQTRFGGNAGGMMRWLLDAGLRIAAITIVAYFVINTGRAGARRLEREMSHGSGLDALERTRRAQTLGRLIQRTLSVVVTGIAALMILRELGADITPVLTGAGIVGLAIGFGAQTLVRDVISGFFLIVEDQVRVGDSAAINGEAGTIEQVNLRTVVLRDEQGAVHVFPNGEIKTLKNLSKDFSFYVITVSLAFDTNPQPAMDAIREAGASLGKDPTYAPHILDPIDVLGVDSYDQGFLVIKARIRTVPQKQWFVGRELRRLVAQALNDRGIRWANAPAAAPPVASPPR